MPLYEQTRYFTIRIMPLLEKIRYFTKGCNDLLIVIDHQSLIKLLGVRRFDEIKQSQAFPLKQCHLCGV